MRYADDCNIYVSSRKAADQVMESITTFVEVRLKLKVNKAKSAVDKSYRRKFLGFSFTSHRQPKRRISPHALKRFRRRVKELTRRRTRKTFEELIDRLNQYLRGWLVRQQWGPWRMTTEDMYCQALPPAWFRARGLFFLEPVNR